MSSSEDDSSLLYIFSHCLNCKKVNGLCVEEIYLSSHGRYYAKGNCDECGKRKQRLIRKELRDLIINDNDIEVLKVE